MEYQLLMMDLKDARNLFSQLIPNDFWGDVVFMLAALVAAAILVLVIKFLFRLIEKLVTSRTNTTLDDRILELSRRSIGQIIYIVAFYFSFIEIREHFSETAQNVLIGIAVTIFIYLICLFISRLFDILLAWYLDTFAAKTETSVDEEFAPLVDRLVKIVIYLAGFAGVLSYFDIDLTGLAIGATAVSFAVGYASQDTLSNMISGFVIMIDRPFRVGDRVRLVASGLIGDVIHIGLRSTKILNFENHVVIIPNSEIAKSQLINYSYPDPAARVKIDVAVAYGSDLEKVKKLLEDTAKSHPRILTEPEPRCYFLEFQDSGLLVTLISRVEHYKDEFVVGEELRVMVNNALVNAAIEIPFPQRVIHMKGNG